MNHFFNAAACVEVMAERDQLRGQVKDLSEQVESLEAHQKNLTDQKVLIRDAYFQIAVKLDKLRKEYQAVAAERDALRKENEELKVQVAKLEKHSDESRKRDLIVTVYLAALEQAAEGERERRDRVADAIADSIKRGRE